MTEHPVTTSSHALEALDRAWPRIVDECRAVLGSELHYQAVVYHCLRTSGQVSARQLGMNVKMLVLQPVSPLFQALDLKKNHNFRGGFEPIPDVVIFGPGIEGDWRRRNYVQTMAHMLLVIEIKASERQNDRLTRVEIVTDIEKLAAHREEARHRGADMLPVMLVVDTAPLPEERMKPWAIEAAREAAKRHGVELYYLSPTTSFVEMNQVLEGVVAQAPLPPSAGNSPEGATQGRSGR